ncbi:hypothetical protein EJB05_04629, partial [Eragrostis curvula]
MHDVLRHLLFARIAEELDQSRIEAIGIGNVINDILQLAIGDSRLQVTKKLQSDGKIQKY